ncbi:mpv17-like protein 2 isoform X1 [Portunus trituberculatus]|uniref:Mpv17-like protein 2 n=1 Tax=Portunus trituberculatus TaxID=210409 RepID=A0A5B7GA26_PORTR|nr:mpv17-like protein 2 isoform X1 [Portunus trituberculatus]XP_045126418.1 mpv17-like protein 2 isoform X1 [Portunus trituberculatus]XP_045126419.1 mpv17-like protein 2 isoform X1 [Portunus trituberculatus]XP_045126420.1 mpv17-like protein 2 isoform X1 [Portunus trituberculatus]XP_045126421.1 mpv17-like protein 2 isoform X1 [Portunus trituberculatus]XP_045126423.1 mpv17-like protein 2 isoform X1 [Portunus trituberculatus]XP_045126425.1 mpv17-like protein 2 isoform X1 [Portunus trituberculatu
MLRKAQHLWSRLFGRYLWITNTVTSGGMLAIGDAIQQQLEHARGVGTKHNYDVERTGRLFLVGVSQGPPHHVFYIWLDKVLPQKTGKVILKKIMADQFLAAPFFAVTFFLVAGLLEGHSFAESWKEFKKKFPAVYAFDWFLWPPSQAINFYLVPAPYRVLYINVVTVIWDVFLSYMKHKDQVGKIMKDEF